MTDLISFGLLSFTSLFTIIDPLSAAPMFVALTEQYDARMRKRAALRACTVALTILLVFAIGGGLIFKAFGITIDALRIAGGILFFTLSMQMLIGNSKNHQPSRDSGHDNGLDSAIVPLGMPMICGPGAISTIMVLMGQSKSAFQALSLLVALVAVIAATALVLLLSPKIVKLIGRTGVAVITRVIGLIVGAIGIQFVIDGVKPVVINILSAAHR